MSVKNFDLSYLDSLYKSNEKLQAINAQINDFILNKLGTKYQDLLEYNLNTPNSAEPITLLVIYDFPRGMDGSYI